MVQQMGQKFKGNKYHLLQLNCNHFANELCLQLTNKPAPSWVSSSVWCLAAQLHVCRADNSCINTQQGAPLRSSYAMQSRTCGVCLQTLCMPCLFVPPDMPFVLLP
jgi:hypothetical protein